MTGMSITWTLRHHGWAVCAVSDSNARAEAVVSYVTGGPEAFLTAVANLVLGAPETRAEFEAEPTVYRWIFKRHGTNVDIRLLEVPSTKLSDEVGATAWASQQPIDALARAVVRAFDAVAEEHGEGGYRATWGRPFPHIELAALRTAWRGTGRPQARFE